MLTRFAAIGFGSFLFLAGCSGAEPATETGPDQNVTSSTGVSAKDFGRMLDDAAKRELASKEMDVLTRALVRPTLTTEKLKLADAFVDQGLSTKKATFDGYQRGGTQIEVLYWAMPRDLAGFEGSGQSYVEAVKLDPENDGDDPSPFTMVVNGTAKSAYTLTFTVAETDLQVKIPSGATGEAAAALVAAEITKQSSAIGESAQFHVIKDFGDFDGLNGVKATAKKGKNLLTIHPDFDA